MRKMIRYVRRGKNRLFFWAPPYVKHASWMRPIAFALDSSEREGGYLTGQFKEAGAELMLFATCTSRISKRVSRKRPPKPRPYRNYHRLLEDRSLDAVIVATPNH